MLTPERLIQEGAAEHKNEAPWLIIVSFFSFLLSFFLLRSKNERGHLCISLLLLQGLLGLLQLPSDRPK